MKFLKEEGKSTAYFKLKDQETYYYINIPFEILDSKFKSIFFLLLQYGLILGT